ncbi:MAG: cyclic nucleotide-binding domain-containing protein [Mariprofundus sp.]|nr:cyclic nucleotide-binding domain-containing protein [Mariprofundus sp.]
MDIELAWLEENVFKAPLDEKQHQQLRNVFKAVTLTKGDTIVKEGEKGGILYLVRSGSVDVFQNLDGTEQRVAGLREGSMIGEVTFLSGDEATATVVATEECVVYTIDRTGLGELMQTSSELVFVLFTFMLLYQSKLFRTIKAEHVKLMTFMSGSHK